MGLSDNQISIDQDGVADAPRNSFLSFVAVAFGILGLFALVEPFFSFFCLTSVFFGLLVIGFAKRWDLSRLSVVAASLCVFIGLFVGLAGAAYYTTSNAIIEAKATEVATNYMLALAKGDRSTAIKMTGLPPMVDDSELDSEKTSREQKAVRTFLADPAIREVIKLGDEASWKSTGLKAKYRNGIVLEFTIGFVDEKSTNPRPILVTVKMIPPTEPTAESRNQWLIESINQAPL